MEPLWAHERKLFMLLQDKVALVTGSTHNIGLGIARAFAREGAKVIVHSRHEEDATKIAGEIRGDYFTADVAHRDQVAAMFDHIRKQHRRLDILVNSVAHSTSGGVLDVSLDEWNRIMTINLTGYFLCIQHAGKMMREQGGGAIINISAGSGERSSPGCAPASPVTMIPSAAIIPIPTTLVTVRHLVATVYVRRHVHATELPTTSMSSMATLCDRCCLRCNSWLRLEHLFYRHLCGSDVDGRPRRLHPQGLRRQRQVPCPRVAAHRHLDRVRGPVGFRPGRRFGVR